MVPVTFEKSNRITSRPTAVTFGGEGKDPGASRRSSRRPSPWRWRYLPLKPPWRDEYVIWSPSRRTEGHTSRDGRLDGVAERLVGVPAEKCPGSPARARLFPAAAWKAVRLENVIGSTFVVPVTPRSKAKATTPRTGIPTLRCVHAWNPPRLSHHCYPASLFGPGGKR